MKNLLRRALQVHTNEGFRVLLRKVRRYATYKVVNYVASRTAGGVNSAKYWDIRLRNSWNQVGGDNQTQLFAISMVSKLTDSLASSNQILDFGCATGESTPILGTAFPEAEIFLHDISPSGVKQGLKKYSSDYNVKAWNGQQVDLVYSSNVIEHFFNPHDFFEQVAHTTKRWVVVQCPWQEKHQDLLHITPDRPNGEHFWTIDDEFLEKYVPSSLNVISKTLVKVPVAWPFGLQLLLLLEKV